MAVIGARPATGIGLLPRRSRPRTVREPQRVRVRHVGAERRRRQASIVGLLATIAAAAGLALFYLSQSAHVAAVGYEIDDLQSQISTLQAQQQQLLLDIGTAKSPTQILNEARWLGLVPLDPRAVTFATRPMVSRSTGAAGATRSPEPNH
jgi:cell division protein FtsL